MCRRSVLYRVRSLAAIGMGTLALLGAAIGEPASAQNASIETKTPTPPLRDLSTDRPDKTESPYTVDASHIQIEMDFVNYTSDRTAEDGVPFHAETLGIAPINLKYGIGANSDLQLIVEPYVRTGMTNRLTGLSDVADGFGDITIRFKRNLFGNDDGEQALALMPFISFPTGARGIGSGFVEGGLILPWATALWRGVKLGLMTEIDLLADGRGHYAPSFISSATLGFELDYRLCLYVEMFTQRSVVSDAQWIVTLDSGVTYALSPGLQLDVGVNVGASRAADDLSLFFGMSRRF